MRHFALALFAAFIALAIIQLTSSKDLSEGSCKALGKICRGFSTQFP